MNPAEFAHQVVRRFTSRNISIAVFFLLSAIAVDVSAWTFVSSPDWFNRDIADLSGSRLGVPKADGWDAHAGLNGISPEMQLVYDSVIDEMASYGPEVFVVSGDLINGRWYTDETLEMFDPVSRDRLQAIDKASDIYYGWYR